MFRDWRPCEEIVIERHEGRTKRAKRQYKGGKRRSGRGGGKEEEEERRGGARREAERQRQTEERHGYSKNTKKLPRFKSTHKKAHT